MSERLYNSMLRKWKDFLGSQLIGAGELMTEDDVGDEYEYLVSDFCRKRGYSERTQNMAFYDAWYDTFADEYYGRLEKQGTKIIHANPTEGDWDYGKKFIFVEGKWKDTERATLKELIVDASSEEVYQEWVKSLEEG